MYLSLIITNVICCRALQQQQQQRKYQERKTIKKTPTRTLGENKMYHKECQTNEMTCTVRMDGTAEKTKRRMRIKMNGYIERHHQPSSYVQIMRAMYAQYAIGIVGFQHRASDVSE